MHRERKFPRLLPIGYGKKSLLCTFSDHIPNATCRSRHAHGIQKMIRAIDLVACSSPHPAVRASRYMTSTKTQTRSLESPSLRSAKEIINEQFQRWLVRGSQEEVALIEVLVPSWLHWLPKMAKPKQSILLQSNPSLIPRTHLPITDFLISVRQSGGHM